MSNPTNREKITDNKSPLSTMKKDPLPQILVSKTIVIKYAEQISRNLIILMKRTNLLKEAFVDD